MRSRTLNAFFLIAIITAAVSLPTAAQITISIPKFPKIKKSEPQKPASTTSTTSTSGQSSENGRSTAETVTTSKSACDDGFTQVHTENMATTLKQAEDYKPGLRNYYVQEFNDRRNEYLRAAISPSKRKEWFEGKNIKAADYGCFMPLLDQINAAAKKTLPTYTPTGYTIRNAAEEKVLRSGVNDLAQATVFKIGLDSVSWKIDKDSYNFPTARYKYGMIWAKYPDLDDGYCRIIYVNLVQDYAGGGTYGDSYGNFIKSEPAGCPAGK